MRSKGVKLELQSYSNILNELIKGLFPKMIDLWRTKDRAHPYKLSQNETVANCILDKINKSKIHFTLIKESVRSLQIYQQRMKQDDGNIYHMSAYILFESSALSPMSEGQLHPLREDTQLRRGTMTILK